MHSLSTPSQPHENGPWVWNTSLPREKSPYNLCQSCYLGWENLSLLRLNQHLFLSLFKVHHSVPGQTYFYICTLQGRDSIQAQEGVGGAWINCPGGRRTPTTKVDLALSLLCISKTLFHSVLDCAMVSLVTLNTRRQWAKAFRVLPWDW